MLIKKISKKTLSRNIKQKKSPLQILPGATLFHPGHQRQYREQKKGRQHQNKSVVSSEKIHCALEELPTRTVKQVKHPVKRKVPITVLPFVTIRFTMNALRWVFLLIFIYLAAGTIIVLVQDGIGSMKTIIIYSVMGFFTFFMGYFGTVFAKDILEVVSGKKRSHDEVFLHG